MADRFISASVPGLKKVGLKTPKVSAGRVSVAPTPMKAPGMSLHKPPTPKSVPGPLGSSSPLAGPLGSKPPAMAAARPIKPAVDPTMSAGGLARPIKDPLGYSPPNSLFKPDGPPRHGSVQSAEDEFSKPVGRIRGVEGSFDSDAPGVCSGCGNPSGDRRPRTVQGKVMRLCPDCR